jgi:hypothetical protein
MKKIRLDLDALKVDSLVTSEGGAQSDGTVFAMAVTNCDATCNEFHNTCHPFPDPCDWPTQTQTLWTLGDYSCTGVPNTNAPQCLETEDCTVEGDTCDSPHPECEVKTEGAGGW